MHIYWLKLSGKVVFAQPRGDWILLLMQISIWIQDRLKDYLCLSLLPERQTCTEYGATSWHIQWKKLAAVVDACTFQAFFCFIIVGWLL